MFSARTVISLWSPENGLGLVCSVPAHLLQCTRTRCVPSIRVLTRANHHIIRRNTIKILSPCDWNQPCIGRTKAIRLARDFFSCGSGFPKCKGTERLPPPCEKLEPNRLAWLSTLAE